MSTFTDDEEPQDLSMKRRSPENKENAALVAPVLKSVAEISLTPANIARRPLTVSNSLSNITVKNNQVEKKSVVNNRLPFKVLSIFSRSNSKENYKVSEKLVPVEQYSDKSQRVLNPVSQRIQTPAAHVSNVLRPHQMTPYNSLPTLTTSWDTRKLPVKCEVGYESEQALDLSTKNGEKTHTARIKKEPLEQVDSLGQSPILTKRTSHNTFSVSIKKQQEAYHQLVYPRCTDVNSEENAKTRSNKPTSPSPAYTPSPSKPAFPGLPAPSIHSTPPLSVSRPIEPKVDRPPHESLCSQPKSWLNMRHEMLSPKYDVGSYQGLRLISEVASRASPASSFFKPKRNTIPTIKRENTISPVPSSLYAPPTPRSPLQVELKRAWHPPVHKPTPIYRSGSLSPPGSDGSTSPSSSDSSPPSTLNRLSCSLCGRKYATIAGLARHQQHCTPGKLYSCPTCEKTYTSCGALKMHIRTHTLPCKCDICGKSFSRPWLLQGHIRTHTGEKPFHCTDCDRSFADRSNLRAHQQTHVSEKKYKCRMCGKTFARTSLLSKHEMQGCHLTQRIETLTVVHQPVVPLVV